ncbi:MAG: hypothetical protein WCP07_00560 [bacterium]
MTYSHDTTAPRIVARLRFADDKRPDAGGELQLLSDSRFVFAPSQVLFEKIQSVLSRTDENALRWGVVAVYGMTALGVLLWHKERKNEAGVMFGIAGTVGVLGAAIRNAARRISSGIDSPRPLTEIRLLQGNDGGLTVCLFGRRLNKILFTISPNEFNPENAEDFIRAIEAARGQK